MGVTPIESQYPSWKMKDNAFVTESFLYFIKISKD